MLKHGPFCPHLGWFLAGLALPLASLAQDDSVPVSIATVLSTAVYDEVVLSGTVSAWRATYLTPRVEGSVGRLLVEEGDEVAAEQLVLELDPTLAQIEIRRVEAELEEARVRYREAVRQRDEARQLVAQKHVAESEVAKADAEVALYVAGVQRLTAELERERERLARHRVRAPFAGVIAERRVELGSWVDAGTELVRLVELDRLRVEVPVPQEHFPAVSTDTPVLVQFDALPRHNYSGTVTTRVPVSASDARTFPVYINIDNAERLIAPGMSARVRLKLNPSSAALVLPKDAVLRDAKGTESVWLVTESDGVASGVSVTVRTGRNVEDWVEIAAGDLEVGDRVVVHGNESLRAGQRLHITEELGPAS